LILQLFLRLDQNSRALQYLSDILTAILNKHLGKMPVLANSLNAYLSRDFIVAQVAEK
jgi:hypothetical protein